MLYSDGGPSLDTPMEAPSVDGPITRSKAKKLQDQLANYVSHLSLYGNTIKDEDILARSMTLLTMELASTPALQEGSPS